VNVKAVARNFNKLKDLELKGAKIFKGDLMNPDFIKDAIKDPDAVFVILPPCYHLSDFRKVFFLIAENITQAIRVTGISHVVLLSSVGADLPKGNGQISSLYDFESMLKSISGLSVIALRCAFFMENLLGSIPLIKNAGINGSILEADSAVSMIAIKDIAYAATEYLINQSFQGYNVQYLLGPKDYTFRQATSIIGAAIGKPDLAYMKFSKEDFIKGMVGAGFSKNAAEALVEGLTALDNGILTENIDRDSSNTTPTIFEIFVREVILPVYNNS
jgi:uncharacterized protein YbjT (DUF2867 family)